MSEYPLTVTRTNHETIRQFETDHFLVNNTVFKFKNSKEAEISPLAKILFQFSFVKAIYIAENFIGIEILKTVSWEEVQEDLYLTIKEHSQKGKPVLNPGAEKKGRRIPITVYTEMTPNPGVLKFICNKKLVLEKVQYDYTEDTTESPLASELFQFPYVKRIIFDNKHILITKGGKVDWNEVAIELREKIRLYLMKGKPVMKL